MAKFNKKKLPSRHTSLGADRAPTDHFIMQWVKLKKM